MKNLDSLTLKFFFEENLSFFNGGVIQKIQMPTRYEIIFYIRNNGENKKFYINIHPKYPHISFLNDKKEYSITIPKTPPMFCMQLRKYLEGAKIISSKIVPYDRILEFYFSITDEFGMESSIVLAIEIMGKYSNVILYDNKTKIIIGSAHNVSQEKSSYREVYGGIKYIYPKKQEKLDILNTSYSTFIEKSYDIPNNFFYFSIPFYNFLSLKVNSKEELFQILQKATFEKQFLKEFWGYKNENFSEILLNYFSKVVTDDLLKSKKKALVKEIDSKVNFYNSILKSNVDEDKLKKYKTFGDLIFQYIYLIKFGDEIFEKDNILIPLDKNLTPAQNAQKYYKMYSKLKAAKEIQTRRISEATFKIEYYNEILFSISNVDNLDELLEIEEEIYEKKDINSKKLSIEPIYFEGFEIYLGKNNKQNDFLIRKISSAEDIWLHAQNAPSSHIIIKVRNIKQQIPNNVLLFAANLVKQNSPYKNTNKGIIIYTKRKYLKRPPNTPIGYVTYKEEKEIIV